MRPNANECETAPHLPTPHGPGSLERSFDLLQVDMGDLSIAILLIQMDHFEALQDAEGPEVGERVLNLAEERIHSALRGHDSVHRLEASKSAILLDQVLSERDARAVAERIAGLLKQPYMISGRVVNASASIGLALTSEPVSDSRLLLKRAGIALRIAKSLGSAKVQLFELATEARMAARLALSLDLRKALLLRQLELHYQPQIHIETRKLIGFEALLRWKHPERGWISPVDFIPLAEETGSIIAIGDWVLRVACEQAARLPHDIAIAVNVSPVQFRTEDFFFAVQRAIAAASIPPGKLEVEITEGVLLQNETAVASTLNNLRLQGVRIAMDDFGTGYSSLGQLIKLPFDTIKIDRSLVGGSSKQRAVVRAIAMLGEGLGISVLAEGIETEEQLADVNADGCVSVQGWLFGKATPASELPAVIARLSGLSTSSYSPPNLQELSA